MVVSLAASARPLLEAPIAGTLALAGLDHGAKEMGLVLVTLAGGLTYVALAFATRALTVAEVKTLLGRSRR